MLNTRSCQEKVKSVFRLIAAGNRPYSFALFNGMFPTDGVTQYYGRKGCNVISENLMGDTAKRYF